jgi:uncharacterized protein (DUF58 family)
MHTAAHHPRRLARVPVRKKPSLDFSLTGLIYTCMMLFMGLAAINSQANLLFGVFGLMIGVLLVSGVISRMVLRRVEVRRILPEFIIVGEPAPLTYEFQNRKRFWPSLSVTISELSASDAFSKQPQAYLLHAAAGTTASVPMLVVPRRRGLHHFDKYQLSTSFPFGFIKRAISRAHSESILIYPPIGELDRRLLALCISAEQSGSRQKPRRGGEDEFYGVKEYRPGENPRHINWKRSARTGTLVSKEMSVVAPPRVLLLVDTHLEDQSVHSHARVEQAIAMAATLVSRTIDQNLAIGLYAWTGQWTYVPPNRGKRHAHELLAILAQLPFNTQHPRGELLADAAKLLQNNTTPIVFTPHALEQSLGDLARGNWIVIAAGSEQARRYFRFDPAVSFEDCTPLDQHHAPLAASGQPLE